MAEEKPPSRQAGLTVAEAVVWLALIAAIVVLVMTGHGEWVIVAAIIAFFML